MSLRGGFLRVPLGKPRHNCALLGTGVCKATDGLVTPGHVPIEVEVGFHVGGEA